MILQHSIKQVLVAMLNMIMHEVATLTVNFRREVSTIRTGKIRFCFASGIAISAVLLTFKSGDHVIHPMMYMAVLFASTEQILNRFNIEFTTVDTTKLETNQRVPFNQTQN